MFDTLWPFVRRLWSATRLPTFRYSRIYRGGGTVPYMDRWILQLPSGHQIRVHHILVSDVPVPHDHPFNFWTLILYNAYWEIRGLPGVDGGQVHEKFYAGSWRFVPAETPHYLELNQGPVWTLVFTGPRSRKWGFWQQTDGGGWRWKPFDAPTNTGKVDGG